MKSESYILTSPNVLNTAIIRLRELECDGKVKLTISDAGDKSSKQRGLQWRWYGEVAKSGLGGKHEDEAQGVHLISKYRWAIPILNRDDDFFSCLYSTYVQLYGKTPERMEWFISNQVHTESLSCSQMAEFLTNFQAYYSSKGVSLTDPDDLKLLAYEGVV